MGEHIPKERLDPGELRILTERVLSIATTPQVLKALETVSKAKPEERLALASKLLTPAALKKSGVDIPEGVRISARYFEKRVDTAVELADTAAGESIVNALNRARPGLLDELKVRDPKMFGRIVGPVYEPMSAIGICGGTAGACACLGAAGVCFGYGS